MIKVMIERRVAEDLLAPYQRTASKVMARAMQSPGFISGESLKDAANPERRLAFATYRSQEDWESWFRSPERRALIEELRPMLDDDEKITILEHI